MQKDDAWWLKVVYVTFFLLMALVGYKAIETAAIQAGWMERYEWFPYAADAGAIVIGLASLWYLRGEKSREEYMLASIGELRKVTWPSWDETKKMTRIVVVVVGIFAAVVGVFDIAWSKVLKLLLA